MLSQQVVQRVLDAGCQKGADFSEVFVEESRHAVVGLQDRRIDQVENTTTFGVGIRLIFGNEVVYGYSNDANEQTLIQIVANLADSRKSGLSHHARTLQALQVVDRHLVQRAPDQVPKAERVELLRLADSLTREQGAGIKQVGASTMEKCRSILIANSEGLWVEDQRSYARFRLSAVAEKGDGPQMAGEYPGALGGYEFFESLDLEDIAKTVAHSALTMADAGYIEGAKMPVVLGNGFGGVIFHEACGHPLETEAIRKNASPFVGKVGQAVAQPVLTAIDDGTLTNRWGSLNVDDEGEPAQQTTLIENGVLLNYLSDRVGAKQVGCARSGSARRESYRYAPVSRMRNTYIAPGPDNVEAMIGSVDHGLYAKKMGGGSVDPASGEFNFAVQEGYVIRKGKIAEPVRGATLIGKGHEVLPAISMIGSDLELAAGICGASSGMVPTTVGQPTLKIDSILVGGR